MRKAALSIDVEDWFQLLYRDIGKQELSPTPAVLEHFYTTLAFLEKIQARATFFVLGELALYYPQIVKMAIKKGHEIASHGYNHIPLWRLTPQEFKEDLTMSIKVLEDIGGQKVIGYRAPRFSLTFSTQWAWDVMAEVGLKYSSSLSPLRFPIFYYPTRVARGKLVEFPLTCFKKFRRWWNISGGRTLRLLPEGLVKNHFAKLIEEGKPVLFYFHTYEMASSLKANLKKMRTSKKVSLFFLSYLYNFRLNGVPKIVAKLAEQIPFVSILEVISELENNQKI